MSESDDDVYDISNDEDDEGERSTNVHREYSPFVASHASQVQNSHDSLE